PATRLWMEFPRILARGEISLHPRPQARALRSIDGSRSHEELGAEFESHARNHRRPTRLLRSPLHPRSKNRRINFERTAEAPVAGIRRRTESLKHQHRLDRNRPQR